MASSSSSSSWTDQQQAASQQPAPVDPYKELELYLEKAHVSSSLLTCLTIAIFGPMRTMRRCHLLYTSQVTVCVCVRNCLILICLRRQGNYFSTAYCFFSLYCHSSSQLLETTVNSTTC